MSDPLPSGVLVIDKPAGWTSHDVVAKLRGLTRIRQIGHSGTLDPMATGVLVLCLGKATRLLEYLTGQPKTYLAGITLGAATDTYDATGMVTTQHLIPEITPEDLENALDSFRGDIMQTPPAYSAIKRDGIPQYQRARRGEAVELAPRPVTIHELTVVSFDGAVIEARIGCSSGTYVRSIAHDLGQALGCGAHLSSLRRLAVGTFGIDQAVTLEQLAGGDWRRWLLPPDCAVAHLARVDVTRDEAALLVYGQSLATEGVTGSDPVCTFDPTGRLVAIVRYNAQRRAWQPVKVLATPDE
jgi:tRNA pseudouridine55 synthase